MNPKIEEIVWELRLIIPALTLTREVDAVIAAADLIEQLQQELIDERYRHDRLQDFCVAQGEELSKLKEQQRWIPVTERLPGEDTVVLSCDAEKDMAVTCYFAAGFMNNMDLRTEDNITHWKPLPEPPME